MKITNSIVGIVVGLVLALIIVLILRYTIFKDKKMTILYVVIFVIFAVCGGVIQNQFFTVSAAAMPKPQEQIETLDKEVSEGWKNTNGGFTFEQIQKAQDDNECPSADDKIIDLRCHDFGSYIVFSYKKGDIYPNAVFYKSNNGLILDGIMNIHVSMTGIKWFLAYDLNSFKWIDDRTSEPNYKITHVPISWDVINGKYDNLLSLSRQSTAFLQYNYKVRTNKNEMTNYVMKNIANLTGQNITSHFIKFGDVELIGTANTGFVKINSFYNYLYEQIKGQNYDSTKLIDATTSLCLPIPSALQQNYPISIDKQVEYGDKEYYGVYRCNIAVNLNFVKGQAINSTIKNEEYIKTVEQDEKTKDKVEIEKVDKKNTFTKISLAFKDTKDSDVTNVNLLSKPIKILFRCTDLNLSKVVTIDSLAKLQNGFDILLNSNQEWTYLIESEQIIFENFQGSITIKETSSLLNFDYYYLNNFTVASVGLNPIGSVDVSKIDLVKNPVKIILANDKNSYQFVFDDNSKLDKQQSMLVEMGDYTYTILSKQLEFAAVTGQLTITPTDKIMLFNYALTTYNTALSFGITVSNYSSTNNQFYLYSESSNVDLIRETLSSAKVYKVTCVIYDKDGKLLETFNHTHQSTGTCSDTWYASHLIAGENYTLQLRFSDRDDPTITYLSDIADFTFNSGVGYRVVYTTTKNN